MSGGLPPSGPAPGTSHAEMVARVARLEAGQRRLAIALGLVAVVAAVAMVALLRDVHLARTTASFDTVSARQFLVKDGGSTRAMFGMYDKPPGAVLLLGPDNRHVRGVAMHDRGEVVVRGGDYGMIDILGTQVSFVRDDRLAALMALRGQSVQYCPAASGFRPELLSIRDSAFTRAFLDSLHRAFRP